MIDASEYQFSGLWKVSNMDIKVE